MLSAAEARALEPALQCEAALLSPSTGIIDSHGLMLALQGDLERGRRRAGLCSRRSQAVRRAADGHVLKSAATSRWCCVRGASSTRPGCARRPWRGHARAGCAPRAAAHFSKGSYYALAGRAPFSRLVYPMPQDAWLGVHLTLDLAGQARFGPDVQWLDVRHADDIDYRVDPARADGFYAEVRRYWPGLPDGALQPAYSGVRPKIHGPGEPAPDFCVQGPAEHGVAGLVNLFGIESPGLTAALAIGDLVCKALDGQ